MAKRKGGAGRPPRQPPDNWPGVAKYFIAKCFRLIDTGKIGPLTLFVFFGYYGVFLIRYPANELSKHVAWLQSVLDRAFYSPWIFATGFFALSCYLYRLLRRQRETYRQRIDELAGQKAELEKKLMPNRLSSQDIPEIEYNEEKP